jgi:hypothetical protein
VTQTLDETVDTVEIVGEVTGPPDVNDIFVKLCEAAEIKASVTLTPGEVRVLSDHLT